MSDSSDCSDYEDQAGIHPHCLPEKKVLNSKYKTGGGDDWPTFLLEDATVYLKDGVTIANLLNVEMEGLFIIRGRLVVEWGDDETKCCKICGRTLP
jgi:hypothetical protein